jgi:DNA-binding helix-hairpin-helix protein with protein kinase domain
MQTVYNREGQAISLTEKIAEGGEGVIWKTSADGYVAKIYKEEEKKNGILRKEKKIEFMVNNPPENPTSSLNHISIAWPSHLLEDKNHQFVGFLMPEIKGSVILPMVYIPVKRKQLCPDFNWQYLYQAAKNIAWIVYHLHAKGYILGDMKTENLLVNNRSLVTVVDTDSFQVYDPQTKQLYPCAKGTSGMTPPEILGQDLQKIRQEETHDYFRLAVIIHFLLFVQHPFTGEWKGIGDPPGEDKSIDNGWWPYAPNSFIKPSNLTISLETTHPKIQEYFLRCFNDGHKNPKLRPTAQEWYDALDLAIKDLTVCSQVKNHVYSKTYESKYGRCYWCDRARNLKVDIFATTPSPPNPQQNPQQNLRQNPQQNPQQNLRQNPQQNNTGRGCLIAIAFLVAITLVVWVVIR